MSYLDSQTLRNIAVGVTGILSVAVGGAFFSVFHILRKYDELIGSFNEQVLIEAYEKVPMGSAVTIRDEFLAIQKERDLDGVWNLVVEKARISNTCNSSERVVRKIFQNTAKNHLLSLYGDAKRDSRTEVVAVSLNGSRQQLQLFGDAGYKFFEQLDEISNLHLEAIYSAHPELVIRPYTASVSESELLKSI